MIWTVLSKIAKVQSASDESEVSDIVNVIVSGTMSVVNDWSYSQEPATEILLFLKAGIKVPVNG